jgi:hypothetical protein
MNDMNDMGIEALTSELREDFRRCYKIMGRQMSERGLESSVKSAVNTILRIERSFLANATDELGKNQPHSV